MKIEFPQMAAVCIYKIVLYIAIVNLNVYLLYSLPTIVTYCICILPFFKDIFIICYIYIFTPLYFSNISFSHWSFWHNLKQHATLHFTKHIVCVCDK